MPVICMERFTVDTDTVLGPLFRSDLSEATNSKLRCTIRTKVLRGTVGSDGASTDDASARPLFHHLLRGKDVGVHEAKQVDPDLVLHPSSEMCQPSTATKADARNSLRRALKQRLHLGDTCVRDADEQPWTELVNGLGNSLFDLLGLADI